MEIKRRTRHGEHDGVNDEEANEDIELSEPVNYDPSQDSNVSFRTLVSKSSR